MKIGKKRDISKMVGWRESESEKQNKAGLSDSRPAQNNWVCREVGDFAKHAASLRFSLSKKGGKKTPNKIKGLRRSLLL